MLGSIGELSVDCAGVISEFIDLNLFLGFPISWIPTSKYFVLFDVV